MVIVVLAVAIVVTAGFFAYTSTLQSQTIQQPAQVTWRDAVGNPITSVSLTSTGHEGVSKTISFTCNPGVGTASLKLSSNLASTVTLSHLDFSSCGSSANDLTLTIPSGISLTATGTLQVVQTDLYKTLSGQLMINVQES